MTDDANNFLPDRDLLTIDLASKTLDEIKVVILRVEDEATLRQMIGLGFDVTLNGYQANSKASQMLLVI